MSQFDTHKVFNSKVDALTHQIDDAMLFYAPFFRELSGHTTIWYEPLEEENVGHEGCHEVTCDTYKQITASAQRRLSIERVGIVKDGAFLATFGKGAINRVRSARRSSFDSKLMHEHRGETRDVGGSVGWICHLRLRPSAELGRTGWRQLSPVAHARVRSPGRAWHSEPVAYGGTVLAVEAHQEPHHGRCDHGLLVDDG